MEKQIQEQHTKNHIFISAKTVFIITAVVATLLIFFFNLLTPLMSDDLIYGAEVAKANSIFDLFRQEYNQYMTWNGRSLCHIILRFFLLTDKKVFDVANSLVFLLLTLLIYQNVEHKKKYDVPVYILINLFVWIFAVMFRQTILWETGACNYLWGTTIILGFVTLYRKTLLAEGKRLSSGEKTSLIRQILKAAGFLLFGILAGWCNENTSGGGLLLCLLCLIFYLYKQHSASEKERPRFCGLRGWMITGLIGQAAGLIIMVLAPGNADRAASLTERHSGLFGYLARAQKITLAIRDNFWILLIIGVVLFIIVCMQKKTWKAVWETSRNALVWTFVFLVTCYALVMTAETMPRAYFGAGIFLIVAVIQLFTDVSSDEAVFAGLKTALIAVLFLYMFFTYAEDGANLARISRDARQRENYLIEQAQAGVTDVEAPMLRQGFDTIYSDCYEVDLDESPTYWINRAYARYYGFDSVTGVPRDEWTGY